MSQVHALQAAESAARGDGTYTLEWDSLDKALAEGRIMAGSIDAHDSNGTTALHIAVDAGRTSTVRALVAAGASLDVRRHSAWSPLTDACRWGHHECVAVLVAAGADVNMMHGNLNESVLSVAAERSGCLRCIRTLLDAGARVNGPRNSWSPLHGAVWGNHRRNISKSEDCVNALLRAGADINAMDHLRRSPLYLAMYVETDRRLEDHPCRLVTTLLRKGARLEAPDELPAQNKDGEGNSRAMAYVDAVRQAGGIARYETMRRAPFVAAFTRCGVLPIPSDTIPIVVEFWVRRALEY